MYLQFFVSGTGRGIMKDKQKEIEETEVTQEEKMQESKEEETPAENEINVDELVEDITKLQAELEKIKSDSQEYRDRYLRTLADFDNFRKRQRDETSRLVSSAKEEIIASWLQILDNFRRAVQSAEDQHDYDSLVEGVSLTTKQMDELIEKQGVEPIESVGQEFNPELHEAMMRSETDDYPENTVIEEFEKGYTINGKVIRPARVRVAVSPQ